MRTFDTKVIFKTIKNDIRKFNSVIREASLIQNLESEIFNETE